MSFNIDNPLQKFDSERSLWEPIHIQLANLFRPTNEFSKFENSLSLCSNDTERVNVFRTFQNFSKPQTREATFIKDTEQTLTLLETSMANLKSGNLEAALRGFTHAIMFAPPNTSTMAMAFSGRAEYFINTEEWDLAALDINEAIKCSTSTSDETKYKNRKLQMKKEKKQINKANASLTPPDMAKLNINAKNSENCKNYIETQIFNIGTPSNRIPTAASFVEMQLSSEKGRGLFTTKDIPVGTVTVVEEPYVKMLFGRSNLDTHRCHFCLATTKRLISCPNCVFALYCSPKCLQDEYEKYHKYECSCLPFLHDFKTATGYEFVFRALCTVGPLELFSIFTGENPMYKECSKTEGFMKGCDPVSGVYDCSSYLPIYHLYSKSSCLRNWQDVPIVNGFILLVHVLEIQTNFFDELEYTDKWTRYDFINFVVSIALRHILSFSINAFALRNINKKDLSKDVTATPPRHALGIFSVGSLFNHSCTPNLGRVNSCDGKLAFVTIKPLKKGDELLVSYVPHYFENPLQDRKHILGDGHGFSCKCPACEGNWPLLEVLDEMEAVDPGFCCPKCATQFSSTEKQSKDFQKCRLLITAAVCRCAKCGTMHQMQPMCNKLTKISKDSVKAEKFVLSRRPLEAISILKEILDVLHTTVYEPSFLIATSTRWYDLALTLLVILGE